jgi:hypothetical protein
VSQKKAIDVINKHGTLLVFPIVNKKEPKSIWSCFHPRTPMRWDWNEDGDDRVMKMWFLMKTLSKNPEVVYSKWYQGRATFFSKDVFAAMLRIKQEEPLNLRPQSQAARDIFECLESDSPLSTKELKKMTGLQGKSFEGEYNRGLKELFQKLLVVGFGEVEDGAFPSLAVGATQLIHEDLWHSSRDLTLDEAQTKINSYWPQDSVFKKHFVK